MIIKKLIAELRVALGFSQAFSTDSPKSQAELAVEHPSWAQDVKRSGLRRGVILGGLLSLFTTGAVDAESTYRAGNPIVYGVGLCDPDSAVDGDRVFLYGSHDPEMKDWWVWSSDNMVDWKLEGDLPRENTFLDAHLKAGQKVAGCWATSGISNKGKYYWYYCSGDEIGVSVSDTPRGPWKDPLGKPLVAKGDSPTSARDPDVFRDDDGKHYLVFGVGNYQIVRLNEDLISLAEKISPIKVINAHGPGGFGKLDDKPALHKYNGRYYLSYSSYYAVSDNVYGPYLYRGYVIDQENTSKEFRIERCNLDRIEWREQGDFLRHDRHGNFFEFNNQWYYWCNDSTHLDGNRSTIIGYAHYRDNGDIAPVRFDLTGVGQYDALNHHTEAEDYFKLTDAVKKEGISSGFVVQNITTASRIYYPRMRNLCANTDVKFCVASKDGGEIEVRQDGPDGKVLGVCKVAPTGSLDEYKVFKCRLENPAGTTNLCLTFKGVAGELMRLDWFTFPDSRNCLAAFERWYIAPDGGRRLAVFSAKASSESYGFKPEKAVDGDVGTFWMSDETKTLPQALTVDLGKVENDIKEVRLSQRPHSGWIYTYSYHTDYIRRIVISLSENGTDFVKVAEEEWPADPMRKEIAFTPKNARYIKIEALETHPKKPGTTPGSKVAIEEVQVVTATPSKP